MKLGGQTAHAENQNIRDDKDIPDVSMDGPVKRTSDTCNRIKEFVSSNIEAPDCLAARCKTGTCEDAEVCDQLPEISVPSEKAADGSLPTLRL